MEITHSDELKEAVIILENPGLLARVSDKFGETIIKRGFSMLPNKLESGILHLSEIAIKKSLDVAVFSLGKNEGEHGPAIYRHKLATGVAGAVGGFFGTFGLTVELPMTTVMMLRSIADIAKSEGEDIRSDDAKLQCISVFSLGGGSTEIDDAETVYYAGRIALSKSLSEAASYLGSQKAINKGAPALVAFISKVSSRFGIVVSEKALAQALPIIGAVGGATINLMFINHFQGVAKGHFTVRRLERIYGADYMFNEYSKIKEELGNK